MLGCGNLGHPQNQCPRNVKGQNTRTAFNPKQNMNHTPINKHFQLMEQEHTKAYQGPLNYQNAQLLHMQKLQQKKNADAACVKSKAFLNTFSNKDKRNDGGE